MTIHLRRSPRTRRQRIEAEGDRLPIAWVPREARYVEKLATPDVTIADMIGDIDPIKAAKGGLQLGSELAMHFGLLPRANRGLFRDQRAPRPCRQDSSRLVQHPAKRATFRSKAIRCACRST